MTAQQKTTRPRRTAPRRRLMLIAAAVVLGVLALYGVWAVTNRAPSAADDTGAGSGYRFTVGDPGPGDTAPDFTLPATNGKNIGLADFAGQNVLLYFHEGGGCQPCWDQIGDIEDSWADFESAGIDRFIPITSAPVDLHARKLADDGITTVGLSDPDLAVSQRYDTNSYGMMRGSANGHSFILVDGDGTIRWRADYGGAPDYTMYLAPADILADLDANRTDR